MRLLVRGECGGSGVPPAFPRLTPSQDIGNSSRCVRVARVLDQRSMYQGGGSVSAVPHRQGEATLVHARLTDDPSSFPAQQPRAHNRYFCLCNLVAQKTNRNCGNFQKKGGTESPRSGQEDENPRDNAASHDSRSTRQQRRLQARHTQTNLKHTAPEARTSDDTWTAGPTPAASFSEQQQQGSCRSTCCRRSNTAVRCRSPHRSG